MGGDHLDQLLEEEAARRREADLWRQRRALVHLDSVHVEIDGRRLVNFASNNYLGLTHHPRIIAAIQRGAAGGTGSGASALISGYTPAHAAAEAELAAWKGTESAILLPSGYQAAHAVVQTLAHVAQSQPAGGRFLIDKLAHASLIDAARASGLAVRVFPHNHTDKLRRLLSEAEPGQLQIVLTESIFSMDGDYADLAALAELKQEHPFTLVLDEAHGSGVYGPHGAGYAAEVGLQSAVDVSIVTLSKAMGLVGGAICASRKFVEAIVNFGRAYIYSTLVPPMLASAVSSSIAILREEPQRQRRVRELARRLRERLGMGGDSPIVPLILGEPRAALDAAAQLEREAMLVVAVRPPTVARGTSRLRITLSCDHSDGEVELLGDALGQIRGRP